MTSFIRLFLLSLIALGAWADEPPTRELMLSRPEIEEVRLLKADINAMLERGELKKQTNKCTVEGTSAEYDRGLYKDKQGVARRYFVDGGSVDMMVRMEYYYDDKAVLRYMHRQRTFANGTRKEEGVYFGADGTHLFTDQSETGPGYPDDTLIEFILEPVEDFSGPCREQA
ncbi:MAG: hypothetical protein KJ558_06335 [Gammaproteobacteria bacterium]|nr:hypothetical protein [Gammaproteobacteria bacterium]MBU1654434.1 hypothetical protein [Gammaproteobacteria bacterium]MBU1960744.1 hypothetical protein [Gammaproteobacteria bacterium]